MAAAACASFEPRTEVAGLNGRKSICGEAQKCRQSKALVSDAKSGRDISVMTAQQVILWRLVNK